MSTPIFKGKLVIQKFEGKGGWHYIAIPKLSSTPGKPFGMRVVKGKIDSITFAEKRLMPIGDGKLMLPLDANTRKQLGKKVNDSIVVELYDTIVNVIIPKELEDCLALEPSKASIFYKLPPSHKRQWINYIYESKKEETRANRIIKMLDSL
jgi:hypothetical protein